MPSFAEAHLPQGLIRGILQANPRTAAGASQATSPTRPVCRFGGIPYAAAPVGNLRFAPPQPATWSGILDATGRGAIAPQLPSRLRDVMGDIEPELWSRQAEDCLQLTVWTPATDGSDRHRRPVLVWLHGGAWQSGAGALDWYDGARLAAAGDIVVVAVNYRLAALGWLTLPGQTANLGLLDQELAISWVADHIAAFGGNPDHITVMGQSAGASSVVALLARQPRFAQGIVMSGALGRGFRSREQAERLGAAFLQATGARDLEDLRRLPVAALLAAQADPQVMAALQAELPGSPLFGIVADGTVLPADLNARTTTLAGQRPMLIGTTRDEMAAFPGHDTSATSQAVGERVFGAASRAWAEATVAHGGTAWQYRFDHAPTARYGACHCIELPYVFDTFAAFTHAPMLGQMPRAGFDAVAAPLRAAWLAFIRGDSPGWPQAPHLQIFA